MVQLDSQLLKQARHLTNEANVHRLKEMIFAYEEAVDLHNLQRHGHEIYRMQSELKLRKFVLDCQEEDIRRMVESAIEAAKHASIKSSTLADRYDQLQEDFVGWTQMENTTKRVE